MKTIILASGLALLLTALAFGKTAATAKADLINSKGEPVGTAKFKETPKGVRLTLQVSNLPPGAHGFHLHAVGKCEPRTSRARAATSIPKARNTAWRTRKATTPATFRT